MCWATMMILVFILVFGVSVHTNTSFQQRFFCKTISMLFIPPYSTMHTAYNTIY